MHGVKRTRISPQAAEAKRLKDQAKIEAYAALQAEVMGMKQAHQYNPQAFKRTADLLDLNPEYYTVWNYRRHILLRGLFPDSSAAEVVNLLATDIRLTTAYLRTHPKVYWIWNHRKWCLENVPLGPGPNGVSSSSSIEGQSKDEGWRNDFWKTELRMLEAMLDADPRNFHARGYRRYVLQSLPASFTPKRTAQDELRYTQKKIEANFSNFSAWHLRTKLLGGEWEKAADESTVRQAKDEEFELVTQALWTDPNDQSGWLYHRWLIGPSPPEDILRREVKNIRELHETEPNSKWCMNALAHNCSLLADMASTNSDERGKLIREAKNLYGQLEVVDADRKERYRDMGAAFGSHK